MKLKEKFDNLEQGMKVALGTRGKKIGDSTNVNMFNGGKMKKK